MKGLDVIETYLNLNSVSLCQTCNHKIERRVCFWWAWWAWQSPQFKPFVEYVYIYYLIKATTSLVIDLLWYYLVEMFILIIILDMSCRIQEHYLMSKVKVQGWMLTILSCSTHTFSSCSLIFIILDRKVHPDG